MESSEEALLASRGIPASARASLGPAQLEAAQEALGALHARVAFLTTATMGDDASGILDAKVRRSLILCVGVYTMASQHEASW